MFRALDHEMVPKHEVLTVTEKKEVLETLGIGKDQLPLMKETDPVAKDTGAKPGDVLLRAHQSNYEIQGFTHETPLSDLVALGAPCPGRAHLVARL